MPRRTCRAALGNPFELRDLVYNSANSPEIVQPLNLPISNPPTLAQVEAVRDKVNELLAALRRS